MLLNQHKNNKKNWMDEKLLSLSTVKAFLYIIQIQDIGMFRGEILMCSINLDYFTSKHQNIKKVLTNLTTLLNLVFAYLLFKHDRVLCYGHESGIVAYLNQH